MEEWLAEQKLFKNNHNCHDNDCHAKEHDAEHKAALLLRLLCPHQLLHSLVHLGSYLQRPKPPVLFDDTLASRQVACLPAYIWLAGPRCTRMHLTGCKLDGG